jgi:transcriptional/translational regulatory protein YebC/TACO1
MFERKSQIIIEKDKATEDQLMELALEAGADDVRDDGDSWVVLSAPEAHATVLETLHKAGVPTVEAEIGMIPKNPMKVEGKHVGGMLRMLEVLEDHDDTQNVYTNFDYDEDAANG